MEQALCPATPTESAGLLSGRDFQRIGRAISLLQERWQEQPSLAWVGQELGISEFHLQRLFTRWVGISPKKFLQYVTKEAARAHLQASGSLLETSLACGLSGSSRLHDLFVRYEGMTPGEFKDQAAGLTLHHAEITTPFGEALAIWAPRGLHRLEFFDHGEQLAALWQGLREEYPESLWAPADAHRCEQLQGAFLAGHAPRSDSPAEGSAGGLSLFVTGTPFQLKVWEALLSIPQGHSVSYGRLAAALGKPGAARAVGNAVAANALAWLIPCHRVICEQGVVGRFRWGRERKTAILGWEWSQQA